MSKQSSGKSKSRAKATKSKAKAAPAKKAAALVPYAVGILDTKAMGRNIEEVGRYHALGFETINSADLDRPTDHFDILVSTWTRLNAKRLKAVGCKGVIIKDNDEPDNVVDPALLQELGIPYGLIDNWGINTRLRWNIQQIDTYISKWHNYSANTRCVTIVGSTVSHDAIRDALEERGWKVNYPILPKYHLRGDDGSYSDSLARMFAKSDVVITHLGKLDFPRFWLDDYLPHFADHSLWISTTRGPLYSAPAVLSALSERHLTAVLDWVWDEERLSPDGISYADGIHYTKHSSYKSAESARELTDVVIAAVAKMKETLRHG